ncbi:hypothetical protein BJX61DRAFT_537640 [Aspergillus egyptiacus]|nr:hypothetical protein BJX61DRAFT_537640 [Aspergillus egyptiacus]
MSDAMCGPSNALQNFQKHTSVDRTLQQDRLVSRQSPSQGFRSQNHTDGVLDPEFAAFESNNLTRAPLPHVQHAGHFVAPAPHMPIAHPAEASNWANDFQNLQISGPLQPAQFQPGPSTAPMSGSQQSWHDEFVRQQQQPHTPVQQNQPFGLGQRFQPSFMPSYGMQASPVGAFTPAQETMANQASAVDAFDESAFEAAFEQAKSDMASQHEMSVAETHASDSQNKAQGDLAETVAPQIPAETIRIGSDTIPQSDKENPLAAADEADELARTAGQLLNSVSHETNQKFRESNFLALMRRIRDREVQIEGDEFRETAQSLHPGGKYYPEGRRTQEDQGTRSWRQIGQGSYVHVTSNEHSKFDDAAESHTLRAGVQNGDTAGKSRSVDHDSLYASWGHDDQWA